MPPDDRVAAHAGWKARLALGFERRGPRSVLASRIHEGPLVVQKSLHPEGDAVCHAIVVHPPAGIAGGDDLAIDVHAASRAHALLTTPGAGKWYRTAGPWARQRVDLAIAAGAAIEWLPQETLIYDGAQPDIRWEARLEGDARLVSWDILCLGRTASGERFTRGECRLSSRLYRDGKLQWAERGHLRPSSLATDSAPGLAGHTVFGTMIVAAIALESALVAGCREESPREGDGGVTQLPGVLVARYRGDSTEAAREYFAALWMRLREPVFGRAAVPPRIWRT